MVKIINFIACLLMLLVLCDCFSLGERGKTVIFSIHQPRYSIYKLFDTMTMLSDGEIVYQGPTGDALEYFESIGEF
jgi:ABC-type multidrug transport system ATPase subunit